MQHRTGTPVFKFGGQWRFDVKEIERENSPARRDVDFAFETTLSGKSYVSLLSTLKAKPERLYAASFFSADS